MEAYLLSSMQCQKHHPKIERAHENEKEEPNLCQQCDGASVQHFHFDGEYEVMFDDRRCHV
jgi:predicted SprT family Zn-dependent metalloprotease